MLMLSAVWNATRTCWRDKEQSLFCALGIDVKDIKQVTCNYAAKANAAAIEIHADSAKAHC